jgi:NAD(P)-dependent dehydrogenase (short-subunit alcohol dehydrogenase family)
MDSTAEVKSILITGCSTGIGVHLARGLRERGYRVFASARQEADVKALEAEGFESLLLDLSSSDSINSAVIALFQKTDHLYALINNGAYGQAGALEDVSRAAMEEQFQANFFGWHELLIWFFRR